MPVQISEFEVVVDSGQGEQRQEQPAGQPRPSPLAGAYLQDLLRRQTERLARLQAH